MDGIAFKYRLPGLSSRGRGAEEGLTPSRTQFILTNWHSIIQGKVVSSVFPTKNLPIEGQQKGNSPCRLLNHPRESGFECIPPIMICACVDHATSSPHCRVYSSKGSVIR